MIRYYQPDIQHSKPLPTAHKVINVYQQHIEAAPHIPSETASDDKTHRLIRSGAITRATLHRQIKTGAITHAGHKRLKIYGLLTCWSGRKMHRANRVFFASENEAIDNGYRPCGHCMREQYNAWKATQ